MTDQYLSLRFDIAVDEKKQEKYAEALLSQLQARNIILGKSAFNYLSISDSLKSIKLLFQVTLYTKFYLYTKRYCSKSIFSFSFIFNFISKKKNFQINSIETIF